MEYAESMGQPALAKSGFFDHPPHKLVADRRGEFDHWFGGSPTHRGVKPKKRNHPVHLLYDLDLRDPALGLASRYEGLSRLPVYNALQYNCCDLVYRVLADDAIEIVSMRDEPEWNRNFPYDNYPAEYPRLPVTVEPVEPEVLALLAQAPVVRGERAYYRASLQIRQRLEQLDYPFPQVGGTQFMWQDIPVWECRGRRCKFSKNYEGKEVLAVIWERPVPGLHLWTNDPKDQDDVGSCQIILSRCTGCGTLHSCNRCD